MPRYFFVVQYPDGTLADADGTDLPTDSAALELAQRIIRDLKNGGDHDEPGLTLIVKDETERIVFSLPLQSER
jgi:hypothetical protein